MKILGNVIKSQSDRRLFRGLELKNKIQCLLVSDQDAQMCSAALSVGVGSLSDPMEAQGLAHYLEHMLFMGTEKYPSENDYSNVMLFLFSLLPRILVIRMPTLVNRKQTITFKLQLMPLPLL
jgi:predicted Zn-dependent peptidase